MKKKIDPPLLEESAVSDQSGAEDAVEEAAEDAAERAIREALNGAGIAYDSLSVDCHIDGEGVINIDRVRITADEAGRVRELLEETFGIGEELCDISTP